MAATQNQYSLSKGLDKATDSSGAPPLPPPFEATLLVTYPLWPPSLIDELRKRFRTLHFWPMASGTDYSGRQPPPPPDHVLREADILFSFGVPSNLVDVVQTPKLKLVQLVGSGSTQVTTSSFWKTVTPELDIKLCNSAGIHQNPIGEHIIMTMLMLLHKMPLVTHFTSGEHRWPGPADLAPKSGGLLNSEIRGQTIGILGYGHIGREAARLAHAFGARIIACTRSGKRASLDSLYAGMGDPEGQLPVQWFSSTEPKATDEFVRQCDVLVNLLPSSPENVNFLDRRRLELMKNTAILVNVGRGDTVDQDALVQALKAGAEHDYALTETSAAELRIAGASLDVTSPEPLPNGHELFKLPNAIITAHTSFASLKNFERACEFLYRNVDKLMNGEPLMNVLNAKRS
ncbi:hypothetical protein OIV83_001568 [Microbotryomycetes sp. JL201]|nr:hypothetical protein OIV83_001568 [Microbotryomycetes sp. JL201]